MYRLEVDGLVLYTKSKSDQINSLTRNLIGVRRVQSTQTPVRSWGFIFLLFDGFSCHGSKGVVVLFKKAFSVETTDRKQYKRQRPEAFTIDAQ